MPDLALVVCPLPAEGAAAQRAHALLTELAGREVVAVFCPEPYQAPAGWSRSHRVLPLADLPHERIAGRVSAPVYLLDGGPGEGALYRYRRAVPGAELAVADAPDAAALRAAVATAAHSSVAWPSGGPAGGPRVEAIVLAYRSKDYIAPCIESLLAQDWPNLQITVLDNASGDGTADFVRGRFPTVDVLTSGTNLGFAAGHNLIFERSRADYVALLNHDAVARRNWISELVAAAEALPKGAVFGSKMLMMRCPTIVNSTGITMNEGGFAVDRDIGRKDVSPASLPERVFAACGGAMLIRGSVLRELGGFDAEYFMYVEDVDLCWRARLAGHEVYYVPTATVVHDWHGDLGKGRAVARQAAAVEAEREGRRRFQIERNRLQTVIKNFEFGNLLRAWRGIRRYDKGRVRALREHVARGGGDLPAQVLLAVQRAHRWCLVHLPGLLRRRFGVQQLRKVPDATFRGLIEPGFHEPSGVGDLHAIVDRHSADAGPRLAMGATDRGCLGPGWHHPEPRDGGEGHVRWSMAAAWFYLRAEATAGAVRLEVLPPPKDTWIELAADGVPLGRVGLHAGGGGFVEFDVGGVEAGRVVEFALRCGAFCPLRDGTGGDPRELGLRVARAEFV